MYLIIIAAINDYSRVESHERTFNQWNQLHLKVHQINVGAENTRVFPSWFFVVVKGTRVCHVCKQYGWRYKQF